MRCPACKSEMEQGLAELVFKVIVSVPAVVCKQCGEVSIDLKTSKNAYDLADKEIKRGVS